MPRTLSSSSNISSGKPAVYTKITPGSGIKSDLSHGLVNNRGVSGAGLPCSSPGTGHCWKQVTGFDGPVAGHSAVPLHLAKARTIRGSGWEPAFPGHFAG